MAEWNRIESKLFCLNWNALPSISSSPPHLSPSFPVLQFSCRNLASCNAGIDGLWEGNGTRSAPAAIDISCPQGAQ